MEYTIEIVETKKNTKTMLVNNLFLHSKYDPEKEAENIANKNYKPHYLHVLFGYGLGYIAENLIKRFKFNEPLLIVDPLVDKGLLQFDKELGERVYFGNHEDKLGIATLLSSLMSYSSKVTIIISPNYNNLFPEELRELLIDLKDSQEREILNVNTINLYAQQWQLNTIMNLKHMYSDFSLENLFLKYKCPIIVASGGPSLLKQIDLLKKYKGKYLLISAGSTTNSLLKYGVIPDYVVSIDGGEMNWEHFKDTVYSTNLIYAPINHYKIRGNFLGRGYYFIPEGLNTLSTYYRERFNTNVPHIYGGASVAHYAYSIAKKMTSNAICLIGQDLAYTNGNSHADGNKGKINVQQEQREIHAVEGYYGDKVDSNSSFKAMKHTFELLNEIDPHSNVTFNCTEGGAKIENFKQISFEEFLNEYCIEENQNSYEIDVPHNENANFNNFNEIIKIEIKNYKVIINLLNQGISITKKENGPLFNQHALDGLNKIDKKLNRLYTLYNLDALMEPIILKNEHKFLPKEKETDFEKFLRIKGYTLELYSDCKLTLSNFIDLLQERVEHFLNV